MSLSHNQHWWREHHIDGEEITLPNGQRAYVISGVLCAYYDADTGQYQPVFNKVDLELALDDDSETEVTLTLPSTSPVFAEHWNWIDANY